MLAGMEAADTPGVVATCGELSRDRAEDQARHAQEGAAAMTHPDSQDTHEGLVERVQDALIRRKGDKAILVATATLQGLVDELTRLRTLPAPSEADVERVAFALRRHIYKSNSFGAEPEFTGGDGYHRDLALTAILAMGANQ